MDYETLKFIWWLLVGALLVGFAIMDGHDMGVGTLLRWVGHTDTERRVAINTIAPHWDGNQVWFITAGGAIFAAWPFVYAAAFSGFYWAMLAVLWALFFRPVGFDYRSKVDDPRWRNAWDWGLFIGGAVPSLVFGVAFGNLLLGVPFHFDDTLRVFYTGSFWALFSPFALLCGVVSLSMLTAHGGSYLALRTEDDVQARSRRAAQGFIVLALLGFAIGGLWVSQLPGYVISAGALPAGPANPLAKEVILVEGGWLANYRAWPLLLALPALGFAGGLLALLSLARRWHGVAFIGTALMNTGVIATAGASMFPFIMPSSTQPGSSLTAWDATSSHFTLGLMLAATIIFLPLIVAYTSWAYRVMRGPVTTDYIEANKHSVY